MDNWHGQVVLITGGTGFIGSHLALRLSALGARVRCLDTGRRSALDQLTGGARPANIEVIHGSVLDRESLAVSAMGVQTVFHMAAYAGVSTYFREPVDTMRVTLLGMNNLMEVLADSRWKPSRVVFLSTSEVYGAHALDADEEQPMCIGPVSNSRWVYSAAKAAAEHLLHAHGRQNGLPVASLRPFNIYGPGQPGEGAVANFLRACREGRDLEITGDGSPRRAWCYVDDMIQACLLAAAAPEAVGKAFNIGNPDALISTLDLARRIQAISGGASGVRMVPHPGGSGGEVLDRSPNIGRARAVLGYAPAVGLDEGLSLAWRWESRKTGLTTPQSGGVAD
ncbi:MAG: dTDP-4-oxo-6-deoxy-D-allose reductase [Myxococcota bacterium]|nr:dTDP-4-oxo-6-deoxy-D-allose reductase [Myxococcota bacterium]